MASPSRGSQPRAKFPSERESDGSAASDDDELVPLAASGPAGPEFESLGQNGAAEGYCVRLHVYDLDPCTGWMNRAFMRKLGLGIFHAGVEVLGEEYYFVYFTDTWDDLTYPGLQRCRPRQNPQFSYVESLLLGSTPLTAAEVEVVLRSLRQRWPACSYHLTRKNCISFASELLVRLNGPQEVPTWVWGAAGKSNRFRLLDCVVHCVWSMVKWCMILVDRRKRRRENNPRQL